MDAQNYDTDKWKDFVLNLLVERDGGTLIGSLKSCWKQKYSPDDKDSQKRSFLFQNCVLDCLENELHLVRTDGKNGISITEKGKRVQEIGYRKYMDSLKRHENIQKINEYFTLIFGIMSLITASISFVNTIFELWTNMIASCVVSGFFIVAFIASKLIKVNLTNKPL